MLEAATRLMKKKGSHRATHLSKNIKEPIYYYFKIPTSLKIILLSTILFFNVV
jgi:hypothetical protein